MNTVSTTSRQTRFVFIRHGAALDVEGRCVGHTDVELSRDGADAIRLLTTDSLSRWITTAEERNNLRVVSSDLRRALGSATIIAAALGVTIETDRRLREMNFGDWDGRLWSDIENVDGDRLRLWTEQWASGGHPPGGESINELARRAENWIIDALATGHRTTRLHIIVSHAGFIRAAVSRLELLPLARMFELQIEHAGAIVIDHRSQ